MMLLGEDEAADDLRSQHDVVFVHCELDIGKMLKQKLRRGR